MISRGYNLAILFTGLLAVSAYCTAAGLPLLAAIVLPLYMVGWWLSFRSAGRLLFPRLVVNALLAGAIGYAILASLKAVNVEVIAQLVIFMLLIKLGDRRGPRDDGQILSMSVFLAIAAMLDSNDFWVGVQLMVLLPLLIGAVMLFQIELGRNGDGVWRTPVGRRGARETPAPVHRIWRRILGPVFMATAGIVLAAGVVFVIMPRGIGGGILGDMTTQRAGAISGFTNVVKLGAGRVISTSPQPVLDFQVRDDAGVNMGGPTAVYYLRGAVLDNYVGGTWTESQQSDRRNISADADAAEPIPVTPATRGPRAIQSITMKMRLGRGERSPIFAVWKPLSVTFSKRAGVSIRDDVHTLDARVSVPFSYRIESAVAEPIPLVLGERTPASFDSDKIRALASEVVERAGHSADPRVRPVSEDLAAARTIQDYLRENYRYTLIEPVTRGGTSAIEEFLLTAREGHCEYFASAMVAMCRSIGINARMIAGFVAAEYVEGSGHYVVRQSNAHAWVEAEGGRGWWRTFDPTPPLELARYHRPLPTLLSRMRQMFDVVEYAWNTSVVGFDERDRERLLGSPGSDSGGPFAAISRLAQRIQSGGTRLFLLAVATGILVFGGVALGGFGIVFLARMARRLRARVWASSVRPGDRDLRFYVQFLDALRRRGLAKPAWRPPLAHAGAIQGEDARAADLARAITEIYYRARFSGRPPTREDRERARGIVRELRRSRPERPAGPPESIGR